jgi:hypothetical protein
MLRIRRLLVAGLLLTSMGGMPVSAEPSSAFLGERQSILDPVQYDDGGRCFNRCISGKAVRRCRLGSNADKENCCNLECNRRNNWFYSHRWYY